MTNPCHDGRWEGEGPCSICGALPCVPEWCDEDDGSHSETCPNHLLDEGATMTKARFVEVTTAAAEQAIDAYRIMIDLGHTHDEAADVAVAEVDEASTCYVGIGSCGRGWCKHS